MESIDTQPTVPRVIGKQLPDIEIPTPPPLRTRRGHFQVFGWDFFFTELLAWADEHNIGVGQTVCSREQMAMREIIHRFPPGLRRMARVRNEESERRGARKLCFVVGTNRTPEDLLRAQDVEVVKQYQEALGWTKPPRWYRYVQDK
ncbi:hypothetical protein DXG01_015492 [Tephrocybe rancida]|nr:hypothetical protein DXG01_015492 [Tephrocybe rancida]